MQQQINCITSLDAFESALGRERVATVTATLDLLGGVVEPFDGLPPRGSECGDFLAATTARLSGLIDSAEAVRILTRLGSEGAETARALTRFAGPRGAAIRYMMLGAALLMIEACAPGCSDAHEVAIATVNQWRYFEDYTITVDELAETFGRSANLGDLEARIHQVKTMLEPAA